MREPPKASLWKQGAKTQLVSLSLASWEGPSSLASAGQKDTGGLGGAGLKPSDQSLLSRRCWETPHISF